MVLAVCCATSMLVLHAGRSLGQTPLELQVPADEQVEYRSPWTMVAVTRLPLEVRAT